MGLAHCSKMYGDSVNFLDLSRPCLHAFPLGNASEGRGFLNQGGANLFENLLEAFSPNSKKRHSRSRPSHSYQPPSYDYQPPSYEYHPPTYNPPPPEPIREQEPVQVVLKGIQIETTPA